MNVYFDKNAEQPDYSDANHVTILVKMTKDAFKARWPKADVSNFDYYDKEWLADDRFKIIKNTERVTALPNIHNAIVNSSLNDEDIICLLDGDDKLSSNYACQIVDDFYKRYNPLLSYGQYVTSNNQMGHCIPYTPQTFTQLRTGGYWASHLRTFKYKLYKEIMNQDPNLSCYKDANGNFYKMTYDVCIMLPLMEMAGLNNIYFNNIPIYFYRLHSNNDHAINMQLQYGIANEVYAKKKFNQVF